MNTLTNFSFHISLGSNYYPNYSMLSRINKFTNNIVETTVNYIKHKYLYQPCDVTTTKAVNLSVVSTDASPLQLKTTLKYGTNLTINNVEITNKSIYNGNLNPILSYTYDDMNNELKINIDSNYSDKIMYFKISGYKKVGKCNKPYVFKGSYYP